MKRFLDWATKKPNPNDRFNDQLTAEQIEYRNYMIETEDPLDRYAREKAEASGVPSYTQVPSWFRSEKKFTPTQS